VKQSLQRPPATTKALDGPHTELLGTLDLARLLKVHPKHVYRLLRRGLPAHRLGGEWRFDQAEVLAWVRRGTTQQRQAAAEAPSSVVSAAAPPPPLLAANGDVCVELLLRATCELTGQTLGFVQADRTSGQVLVESGSVVAAGVHGKGPSRETGLVGVHLTRRQLGLAFPKRTKLRSLAELAGLKLATRPASAGVRVLFDEALRETGLDPERAQRRALIRGSHRDVVLAVLSGRADVGVTTVAWAESAGLASLPFAEEDYRLQLRSDELTREPGRALIRTLQGREIRKLLASVAGYDPRDAGALRL
jgi:putative molybdopterin biosynthesis protein